MTVPVALSIAGSDPSGGPGIQADLKTFSALGAYGTAVVTALTAQNTTGVDGVHVVPVKFVTEQLETLIAAVKAHVIKIECSRTRRRWLRSPGFSPGSAATSWFWTR